MNTATPRAGFLAALRSALADGTFIKLTLGGYRGAEAQLKQLLLRRVLIKREEKLSFTYRYQTRDIVKNHAFDEGVKRVEHALAEGFQAASLFTTIEDWTLDTVGGKQRLKHQPASHTLPVSASHDRDKTRLIHPENKPWLHALKITDAQGTVLKSAQDKFRQINKYVEILSHLIQALPSDSLKKIVDMGAGKGYLTFALADYLKTQGQMPEVVGVEYRADLVALCNQIATDADLANLHFTQGAIADYDCRGANVLIALHACNTATDDAIFKGIRANANLIVVAPCCHKQIRREMEGAKNAVRQHADKSNALDFLLQHGIFMERQAEMVTDGLRALLLEAYGYNTKVFEFISDAHTPKNVLIVGSKRHATAAAPLMPDPAVLTKIEAAKAFFGIRTHHLQQLLESD